MAAFSLKSLAGGVKTPKVQDRFGAEITQQNRRITGVTPKVVRAFQESPARFIPRGRGLLKGLAAGKRKAPQGVL